MVGFRAAGEEETGRFGAWESFVIGSVCVTRVNPDVGVVVGCERVCLYHCV